MDNGLLWFDNSSRGFYAQFCSVFDHYLTKHSQKPELCFVNPVNYPTAEQINALVQRGVAEYKTVDGKQRLFVDGVDIRPNLSVRANHFWIGKRSYSDN
jgi:hypothetical protein